MKIKQIASICKNSKSIKLYVDSNETQWLGDGGSLYPLHNVMELDEKTIYAIFDITEKQQEKIYFNVIDTLDNINLEHIDKYETQLEPSHFEIHYAGKVLQPLLTSLGIIFIDTKYLAPLEDDVELFERISEVGTQYIVAKLGFMIVAVIMPTNVISESLVEKLFDVARQCKIALENNESRETR